MSRRKRAPLRRLVVDGMACLWTVAHEHNVLPPSPLRGRGRERFTAYLEGYPRAPLRIYFADSDRGQAGYSQRGVVWLIDGIGRI